jgi:hypothetical protein
MNPARDLPTRLAHTILPIAGKGRSDWGYTPVPILGPWIGAFLAGAMIRVLHWRLRTAPESSRLAQDPVNLGARFSRKCATPSLKSALWRLGTISATERSKASASVWNIPV